MAALIFVFVVYILIVIWAKRQDKKDLLKVKGSEGMYHWKQNLKFKANDKVICQGFNEVGSIQILQGIQLPQRIWKLFYDEGQRYYFPFEPLHKKSNKILGRKQRRRSASR